MVHAPMPVFTLFMTSGCMVCIGDNDNLCDYIASLTDSQRERDGPGSFRHGHTEVSSCFRTSSYLPFRIGSFLISRSKRGYTSALGSVEDDAGEIR
jgi:hypothetical protein